MSFEDTDLTVSVLLTLSKTENKNWKPSPVTSTSRMLDWVIIIYAVSDTVCLIFIYDGTLTTEFAYASEKPIFTDLSVASFLSPKEFYILPA